MTHHEYLEADLPSSAIKKRARILEEVNRDGEAMVLHPEFLEAFPGRLRKLTDPTRFIVSPYEQATAWAAKHNLEFLTFSPGPGDPYHGFESLGRPLRVGDALDHL